MILARADNGVIGNDGALPWHLPADLKRFKMLTMGKAMIMGRKTFESFPHPLPGRRHVVLTRDDEWTSTGAEVARDRDSARHLAGAGAWIIGGAQIFELFLPLVERIELTEVHVDPVGDVTVPSFTGWREVAREHHPGEVERPAFSFVSLVPGGVPNGVPGGVPVPGGAG